jgi:hypothetical protein
LRVARLVQIQNSFSVHGLESRFRAEPRRGQKREKTQDMKYLFAAAVLVATSFASFSAANAAGGCGAGWHRGPYGGCQPNRGGVVVVERPAPVVVVRPVGRVCPIGFAWAYGRCRRI